MWGQLSVYGKACTQQRPLMLSAIELQPRSYSRLACLILRWRRSQFPKMIDKNLGIDVGIGLDCRNRCQRQRDREPDADAGGRPSMRTRGRAPFYAIRGAPSGQFAPRTETALLERSGNSCWAFQFSIDGGRDGETKERYVAEEEAEGDIGHDGGDEQGEQCLVGKGRPCRTSRGLRRRR
jgi:hypothetical protein